MTTRQPCSWPGQGVCIGMILLKSLLHDELKVVGDHDE
jgi:hypothetical protein